MKRMFSPFQNRLMLSLPGLKARLPARYKRSIRGTFLRASSLLNLGSRVECPVCERHFRRFARFHGAHEQCPGCGSLMRHRAILLYLVDVLRFPESSADVLDVGPSAPMRRRLSSFGSIHYLSVDIDPDRADVQADVTDLQFADESFDFVLCMHVFEHVQEDRKAAAELFRVLRRGGAALIQVPPSPLEVTFEDPSVTDPTERERVFGQYDHVRICGSDYRLRLEEPGFQVDLVDYVTELEPEVRERLGLRVGEPFYVCGKPPPGA